MREFKIGFIFCFVLLANLLIAQCYQDRHSTNAHDGWVSCETSPNPNPIHGETHWILYDLSDTFTLYDLRLWNQSHPTFKKAGIKDFIVEYSIDSQKGKTRRQGCGSFRVQGKDR